jgi:hypothetical protein
MLYLDVKELAKFTDDVRRFLKESVRE